MDLDLFFKSDLARFGVRLQRERVIVNDAFLSVRPWGYTLSIQQGITTAQALEAIAIQLGRIASAHGTFKRSGLRLWRSRRDAWKLAEDWAALRLVPEVEMMRLVRQARKEGGWELWQFAMATELSEDLMQVRLALWAKSQGVLLEFPVPKKAATYD